MERGCYIVEIILLADSSKLIIKRLKIDGFVSSIYKFKVDKIIANNVTLDKYNHLLAGEFGRFLITPSITPIWACLIFGCRLKTTVAMAPFFILLNLLLCV